MKSKREKGQTLEYLVADLLQPIDRYARPSKASGASTELGDVLNLYFIIECKNWNKKNVIINHKIWQHLLNQLPINTSRIPLLIQENSEGKIFVSLDMKDFFDIVYKAY